MLQQQVAAGRLHSVCTHSVGGLVMLLQAMQPSLIYLN
jgi:hypothetical protein